MKKLIPSQARQSVVRPVGNLETVGCSIAIALLSITDLWALRRSIDRRIEELRLAATAEHAAPEPPPAVTEIDCPHWLAEPYHKARFHPPFRETK